MKKFIKRNAKNIRGWRTDKQIIVIESDDWGQVRMPSAAVLNDLKDLGFHTERCHYMQNDALASDADLQNLFSVLNSFEDKGGNPAVITANMVMANPDFQKIKESNYETYFYEPFHRIQKRYPTHQHSYSLMKEGLRERLFYPQFHGREHLQVHRWLSHLQQQDPDLLHAFNLGVYAVSCGVVPSLTNSILAAYDLDTGDEMAFIRQSIIEGLDLFEELFGFRSRSAIAPNYHWNSDVEEILHQNGVTYLQSSSKQVVPVANSDTKQYIRHYLGEQNDLGQYYLLRNCTFEPTFNPDKDWVDSCLADIKAAFRWKKPAIICSHRLNFIGHINPENRDRNLRKLEKLLREIKKNWPDATFMTSDQLGDLISTSSKGVSQLQA